MEAVTATCSSGGIHIGVVRALASRNIASVDASGARGLPALISSGSLLATSYGLAPSCRSLMGLTGCLHSRHTSSLSLVPLRRSSRVGSRPLTPCNVLAAAERRSALNLCKMHHIRPRPRCIPRFHLPLKRYPWRLVVSEGHLDYRWGTLGPAGHLRVELPKRFGSGSWASARGTAQARWRTARTGGWSAGAGLRWGAGSRSGLGRGVQRQKRATPLFIWDLSPIASHARTPGNESWQVAGNGHVDRRDVAARQRPHLPTVDAARGARGGDRLRHPPKAVLHAEASLAPQPT